MEQEDSKPDHARQRGQPQHQSAGPQHLVQLHDCPGGFKSGQAADSRPVSSYRHCAAEQDGMPGKQHREQAAKGDRCESSQHCPAAAMGTQHAAGTSPAAASNGQTLLSQLLAQVSVLLKVILHPLG